MTLLEEPGHRPVTTPPRLTGLPVEWHQVDVRGLVGSGVVPLIAIQGGCLAGMPGAGLLDAYVFRASVGGRLVCASLQIGVVATDRRRDLVDRAFRDLPPAAATDAAHDDAALVALPLGRAVRTVRAEAARDSARGLATFEVQYLVAPPGAHDGDGEGQSDLVILAFATTDVRAGTALSGWFDHLAHGLRRA